MDTAGFRLVCETAVERFGPDLAKFVFKQALKQTTAEMDARVQTDGRKRARIRNTLRRAA